MTDGAVAVVLLVLAVALIGMAQFGTRPTSRWRMVLLRLGARLTVKKLWYVSLILLLATASLSIYAVNIGMNDRDIFDPIYRALTLLSFDASWTLPAGANTDPPALHWSVQTLRFLIPAWLIIAGGWLLAFESVGSWFQRKLMPRRRHTVVFGLGEAGTTFVAAWIRPNDASCLGEKPGADTSQPASRWVPWRSWGAWKRRVDQFTRQGPVIAVERDPDAPGVAVCRAHGIPVVIGDPLGVDGEAVLARAGVQHASTVVGLLPEDVPNIELALRVQTYSEGRRRDPKQPALVFIAQVNDVNLSRRLNYYEKITHLTNTDLRFQNIYRMMAEHLLLAYPPDFYADVFGRDAPHIAIYGFGELGQQVLTQCLRLCHTGKRAPTDITIFDRERERVEALLKTEYPGLWDKNRPAAFDIRVNKIDISVPTPSRTIIDDIKTRSVTQHVVCFSDEKFALSFSLALRDKLMELPRLNAPIFVRTRRAHGLAALLDSNTGQREIPDGLFPFGMLERAIRPSILNNTVLEDMAEAIHQVSYVPFHETGDWAARPWQDLDDHFRRSNRLCALHLDTKLRTVDLRRAPVRWALPPPVEWRDEHERLAELEHDRWVGAHMADGWRYGPTRSNMLRIHNAMCAYGTLKGTGFEGNDTRLIELLPHILSGDAEGCRETVRKRLPEGEKDRADRLDTKALKRLNECPQALFPIRRIGIVSTEPWAGASKEHLDQEAFAGALDQALRDADLGGLTDLENCCAVTIMSPLLHPLERQAAFWLHDRLEKASGEAVLTPPEEIVRPARHQILALLPLPFDVLAGVEAVWGPTDDTGHRPAERHFQDLMGAPSVHYVEMPLERPGTEMAPRDGLRLPAHRAQYEATWRFMARWCALILVLRDDDEIEGCNPSKERRFSPAEMLSRTQEKSKAAVFKVNTDGTVKRLA